MGTWPIYKKHFPQLILTEKPFHLIKHLLATFIFSFLFNLYLCLFSIMSSTYILSLTLTCSFAHGGIFVGGRTRQSQWKQRVAHLSISLQHNLSHVSTWSFMKGTLRPLSRTSWLEWTLTHCILNEACYLWLFATTMHSAHFLQTIHSEIVLMSNGFSFVEWFYFKSMS